MSLILGINSWSEVPKLDQGNAKDVIGKLARLPIPGDRKVLEYLVFDPEVQAPDAGYIKNVAADKGFCSVSVCGFNGGDPEEEGPQFSISKDSSIRKAALDTGYRFIDIAADVTPEGGIARLGGPFYRRHEDKSPVGRTEYDLLVEFLKDLAERAFEKGVELDPEYLNRFEMSGPNNIRQLATLVANVKQAAKPMDPFPIKGQWDIFHSYIEGESAVDAIRYAAKHGCLGTVHLGDSNRRALGSGAFKHKLKKVMHTLYQATKEQAEDVPVIPEIMCEDFRGNVAIWPWPMDDPIDPPYKQSEDSFNVLSAIVDSYRNDGVYLLGK